MVRRAPQKRLGSSKGRWQRLRAAANTFSEFSGTRENLKPFSSVLPIVDLSDPVLVTSLPVGWLSRIPFQLKFIPPQYPSRQAERKDNEVIHNRQQDHGNRVPGTAYQATKETSQSL